VSTPSYAHGTSTLPLLGETIGQNLRRTVERVGDREALVVPAQGYRATYAEFWEQTTRLARGLLALGVQRGDRVGIWSPNRYEWVIVLNNGFFIGETLDYSGRDRVRIPVPFHHCFGMVLGNLACTTHGACMVIPGEAFDPVATLQAATDAARWMHTGDLAIMDEEGYVAIVGRIKDMIIRGGENIYPREVEEFLYTHPAVSDVQVIGVPSLKYGEEVMAWIKLHESARATEDELVAFCRGRIASFKIPRYWKFVDEFPMTITGKIQKFRMREEAARELGLARE
jgi:acyl-CoA synthetase (AMP-forming)/AMP-acid ligase II